MLDALRVICTVLWSIFRPSDQGLSWVFFPTLHVWLRKFAPLSRPIRSKKKANQDFQDFRQKVLVLGH